MSVRRSLRDPALERRLQRDGYVLLPGLGVDILEEARAVYRTAPTGRAVAVGPRFAAAETASADSWQTRMAPGKEWRISMDECDPAERERLSRAMEPLWDRCALPLLVDHRITMSSFLTKGASEDSHLPLHQDPNVIDERSYRSVTMWMALDDITRARDNGPIHVIPASHRVGQEWRGTYTEPSYLEGLEALWRWAVPVDTKAGDVLIMDSRTLHGSPPNRSDAPRAAVAAVLAPREAPLCHAMGIDGDRVQILRVDEQFAFDHSSGTLRDHPPVGYEVVETVPRADPPTTIEGLLAMCRRERTLAGRARRRISLSRFGQWRTGLLAADPDASS